MYHRLTELREVTDVCGKVFHITRMWMLYMLSSLTEQACVFYGNNKVYDSPTENKQFLTVKIMKSGCDLVII